ncbi:MAG: DUF4247 domain-containing protein [Tumebacillaceae bacterium]
MRRSTGVLAAVLAVSVMLAGCGADNAAQFVKDQYSLENVAGQGNSMQKVYRAENSKVPDVAKAIADDSKPDEISKSSDERMFIVYPDSVVQVQQDPDKTEDVLVEVDTKQFVKENYDPSFLQGFLAASLISSMFGNNWRSKPHGGYYGYGNYKSKYGGSYTPPSTGGSYRAPATTPNKGYVKPPTSSKGSGRVIRKK